MPTNSDYDGFFSGIDGIPLFTYGMIATTIVVLSYMTLMEESLPDISEEIQPDSSLLNATVTSSIPPDSLIGEEPPVSLFSQPQIEGQEDINVPPPPSEEAVEPLTLGQEDVNTPSLQIQGGKRRNRTTKRKKPQA
jgi:hypothetical protein